MARGHFEATGYNLAFPRAGAHHFAVSDDMTLGATWRLGFGRTTTLLCRLDENRIRRLADAVEQLPLDDRYAVTWTADRVRVERLKDDAPVVLTLYTWPGGVIVTKDIPQIAPGVFELELPWNTASANVAITSSNTVVAQRVLGAKYPAEFRHIGVNRDTLRQLAEGSGGAMIELGERRQLNLKTEMHFLPLGHAMALLSAMSVGSAVVLLRRRI